MLKQRVAIDIGSGITNVVADEQEFLFPSRVCVAPPRWTQHFGAVNARVCRFADKDWLIGDAVRAIGGEPENTLSNDWALSDGWLALLYSSLAELGIEGDCSLATGLPQALYTDNAENVVNRLSGIHRFSVNGVGYTVNFTSVQVVPQATAALLYQATLNDMMRGDVGCIDIGTYTTGLAVIDMDTQSLIARRSRGCQLGVATLLAALESHLINQHNLRLDGPRLMAALTSQQTRIRGAVLDLSAVIGQIAIREAKPMLEFIQSAWDGGADLEVYLAGGGADYYAQAVRSVVPHAAVIKEPQWAVARGLYRYLCEVA